MKHTFIALTLAVAGFQASAASVQHITCTEADSKNPIKLTADFNPEVIQQDRWGKDKTGGAVIYTYKLGEINTQTTTTARVTMKEPKTRHQLQSYYEVNTKEDAGGGYSYKFDNKAYRSIHGTSEDQTDIMFYYPETVVGENARDFKALVTYQWAIMDQGYFHVDLNCNSKIK